MEIEQKALNNIQELKSLLKINKGNKFNKVFKLLKGFNKQKKMFDCDFKNLVVTIIQKDKDFILSPYYNIYNKQNYIYKENVTEKELIKGLIKENKTLNKVLNERIKKKKINA